MKRTAALGASFLGLVMTGGSATYSHAAADVSLNPAFNNTIVSTHPDGRKARLWFNADLTYAAEGRKGQRSSGVWRLKDAKVCLTQRKPLPSLFSFCKIVPNVSPGQHWSDIAIDGERVDNRIVPGRRGADATDPGR